MKLVPITAALLLALVAAGAAAQAPSSGRLLVATPEMEDGNFARTVVLLLHHDANGAIGVIVNRPTWVKPEDVDPAFGANLQGYDGTVFRGGPLAASQMIYLVRSPPAGAFEAPPIFDGVYAGGNPDQVGELAKSAPDDKRLRLYAGHAEWAAGQLEREIQAGAWVVVEGTQERVFTADPATLWDRISHKGSELAVDARSSPAPVVRPAADLNRRWRAEPLAATSSDPR